MLYKDCNWTNSNGILDSVQIDYYEPAINSNVLSIIYSKSPASSGGSTYEPTEKEKADLLNYNSTLICEKAKLFLNSYPRYTDEDYRNFKNNLIINMGMGIDDSLLKPFLEYFDIKCPEFVDKKIIQEEIEKDKVNILFFLGLILMSIIILVILLNQNLTVKIKKEWN